MKTCKKFIICVLYIFSVTRKVGTLTANRTICLQISEWSRLQEIIDHRGFATVSDALRYLIVSDWKMVQSKQTELRDSVIEELQ